MNYLICYDITSPRRLRKTAKTLERFGIRVQYSFFELDVSAEKLEHILEALKKIIHVKEDKLYVYPICSDCKKKVKIEGSGKMLKLEPYIVL